VRPPGFDRCRVKRSIGTHRLVHAALRNVADAAGEPGGHGLSTYNPEEMALSRPSGFQPVVMVGFTTSPFGQKTPDVLQLCRF
jgi:hypothetical protein